MPIRSYDVKKNTGCQIFSSDDTDIVPILEAVCNWWLTIDDESKCFDAIKVTVTDDGGLEAAVYWSYLSKEEQNYIDAEATRLHNLDANTPNLN